ncbi:MAG TPA: TIR domain-containing protein [Steroidobacteraceae bacterium]|nr:TIR domain-containing protein [Steroidobacteraceae bacterium]
MSEGSRAVFISYASQDAEAARRMCAALRAAGVEVWLDQSELRGGDAWDQAIRQQIQDCALFIPVISVNTAGRPEGYFRLEWSLADQRSQRIARSKSFIVPVSVDATPLAAADVPESFARVQWTRLPGGETPPAFAQRIAALLGAPAPAAPAPPAAAAAAPAPAPPRRRAWWPALAGVAALLILAAVLAVRPWRMLTERAPAPTQTAAGPTAAAERSVAVLPFTDMSERHDQEYFSDGLAEELIDVLAKVPQLRVPARTSSFSFKGRAVTVGEIGRALGVSHVLEGSVRKSGDRMRITAQLVRADDGFHLWSQTYDRDVRDVFAVQDDIAHAVADELKLAMLGVGATAASRTTNTEAHNLFLQAQYRVARDTMPDLEQAVQLYAEALKLDPDYAAAWAGLAYCHTRRISNGVDTTGAGYQKASAAATRAIELDPQLADGYLALAVAKMQYELDWKGMAAALDKVATLDPANALAEEMRGHVTVAVGRMSEALVHFRRSVDLDPLNLVMRKYLGKALHYARRTADAEAVLRGAIAENERFPALHYELGRTLLLKGDLKGALTAFEAETDPAWKSFGLPLGYFANQRLPEAQAALQALLAHSEGAEFQVAEAYGYFGDSEQAFEWLDRAVTQHDPGIIYLRRDALLARLEGDPRYPALLRRVGMPPVPKDD